MDSGNFDKEVEDILEVAVPPIPNKEEARFIDDSGRFQSDEYASYAQEKCGTAGSIAVALEILQDVAQDLNTLSDESHKDELQYFSELVEESCAILGATADQHITDYESPLYDLDSRDDSERKSTHEDQNSTDGTDEEPEWKTDKFAEVTVDRVNGKGNILASPNHLSRDNIHLSHGRVDEEVIIFFGKDTTPYSNQIQIPVVPYDTVQEATKDYSVQNSLELREGDLIKQTHTTSSDDDNSVLLLEGFNIDKVKLDEDVPGDGQITVRVESIDGQTGKGIIYKRYKNQKSRTSRGKSSLNMKQKRNSKRYAGSGNDNPFKSSAENKNDLLSDNPR